MASNLIATIVINLVGCGSCCGWDGQPLGVVWCLHSTIPVLSNPDPTTLPVGARQEFMVESVIPPFLGGIGMGRSFAFHINRRRMGLLDPFRTCHGGVTSEEVLPSEVDLIGTPLKTHIDPYPTTGL